MKVAIVCAGGILSGKEVMVLQLADGLRDVGVTVEVVSSRWSDGKFCARLAELNIPTHKVWFGFISASLDPKCIYMTLVQLLRLPQLLGRYGSFLRRFNPDKVVHTNWHSLLAIFPFLKRDREIYWVHEVMPDKVQYRKVFGLLSRRLKCFIAVSQAVADSLGRLGIEREIIRVIHNGLDQRKFAESKPTDAHGCLNVGIVGQVGSWKGHEDLLNAFAIAARDCPATRLQIYGKGDACYESFLRARVSDLGLTDKVQWRGYVADPNEIYRNLELVAVPSRSEDPLPTVAIEAAFFGLPVVASSKGGLKEIIEHERTGFLFEPGDVEGMARYLVKLLVDASLRANLGGNARLRAENLFGRERFVQSFVNVLVQ